MARVLIADHHGLYRKGLRSTLEAALTNVEVWEAESLDQVLITIDRDGRFDLVLIDLSLRGISSFDSLLQLREGFPQIRVIVISAAKDRENVLGCLRAGVHGYVSKDQPEDEIIGAIQTVIGGVIYAPPWLAKQTGFKAARSASPVRDKYQNPYRQLTPRQRDVLPLLATGMSNKEIARALNIAEATTKIHAATLCRILGVSNRTQAALAARELLKNPGDALSA